MKPNKITRYDLLEVCELTSGTRTKETEGVYFIYGAGINAKGTTDKFNCERNTIRLTRKGTVGAVYFHIDPFWMDSDSLKVEPKEMIDKRYLFHWLLMNRKEIERFADGNNQPGLSVARLSNITLGSLQEIHEYTGIPLERLKEYSKKSRIKRYPFGRMLIEIDEELS